MKRIIAAALLAISTAHAGILATLQNDGGGQIVLTDIACSSIQGAKVAYATSPKTNTLTGCWTIDEQYVHIFWDDDQKIRSYELFLWKVNKKGGNV